MIQAIPTATSANGWNRSKLFFKKATRLLSTVISAWDFGAAAVRSEEDFYDYLAAQDYTVLFIDGNHENFEKLNGFPIETWHGGRVHKIRGNVIHLMRGEVYDIEGHTVFAMGGGYSMDKAYRTQGVSWWPQEMPSQEEYDNAAANLERVGNSGRFYQYAYGAVRNRLLPFYASKFENQERRFGRAAAESVFG